MKKIIIDTDIGFDCDDAGALAIAFDAAAKKKIELLAVTCSIDNLNSCKMILLQAKSAVFTNIHMLFPFPKHVPVTVTHRYIVPCAKSFVHPSVITRRSLTPMIIPVITTAMYAGI